jgi:signal transduction histidine kinase
VSLAARLSTFFLLALAVVLAGFSVSLYLLARSYLTERVDERLRAALNTLRATTEIEDGLVEWEGESRLTALGRDDGPDDVRWQAQDGRGRPIPGGRSPNLGGADLWPGGLPPLDDDGPGVREVERDGETWRLTWRVVRGERPEAITDGKPLRYGAVVLTAGLSLGPPRGTLRALAATLVGLSAAVWLVAALAGRRLCRRALAPVARMADAARTMGAADLGRRLPAAGTDDELEDLRRAFDDLLDRLQEAFERQRRFTGDASHQLRTPLTALLGQVEVALRRDRPAEDYRQALDRARAQAVHLRAVVESLLFLARADLDAELPGLEVLDLAEWLPRHLSGWAGHARAADLRLEAPGGGGHLVRAQPVLLGQLLDNLLDNALGYSQPGAPVVVTLSTAADEVSVAVRDAGPGLAAEDLARVFEPFFRTTEARRQGRAGVGLGLAVAQRIARTFGGALVADSIVGRGSTFTLFLPAAPAPGAAQAAQT